MKVLTTTNPIQVYTFCFKLDISIISLTTTTKALAIRREPFRVAFFY